MLARNDRGEMPTGCGFYPESQWVMPIDRCGAIPGYGDVMRTSTPESDLRRAKQIMAAAGYGPGDLRLELSVWQPIENDYPALALQLGAIGISVEANILDSGVVYSVWAEGDFDIGLHGFGMSSDNPEILLREHFYTGGSRNYGRYSNPEFDDLVDRLSMTRDLWKRQNPGLGRDGDCAERSGQNYHTARSVHGRDGGGGTRLPARPGLPGKVRPFESV